MKKLLSLLIVVGLTSVAFAQEKPVTFGVKAGLALPSQTSSSGGISFGTSSKTSFYIGAVANINISPIFSLQPGLTYIGKGGKLDFNDLFEGFEIDPSEASEFKQTINLSYLELPVNLLANFNAGSGKVFIGAGPYAAYALSGNEKSGDIKEDIAFGSGEEEIKRMEFGLNFLAGYQIKSGLNIHAGYGLGLSNLENNNNITVKNRVFTVGLGFTF